VASKGKPASLAAVTKFMNAAKREAIVRKALDHAGYAEIAVATQ
jgi:hypothetical protein